MKKPCPACSSDKTTHNKIYSSMLGLVGNSNQEVHVCDRCNLKFLSPYFSEQELEELYSKSYFVDSESSDGSLGASSSEDYEETVLSRKTKFLKCIDLLTKLKPDAKNILDIGAATGFFLYLVKKEKGLNIEGIETSSYACMEAKEKYNLDIKNCKLGNYQNKDKFDLIHMNHVFEHLDDPNESIKKIKQLISDDGLLYIEIPYQFNFLEVLKYKLTNKQKKYDIFSLHHPIFYTTKTFKSIMSKHGFQVLYLSNFDKYRYPDESFVQKIRLISWYILSFFKSGNYIEAVLKKNIKG